MKTLPVTESERPTETKTKRKYVQPQIENVRLVPEEAVLSSCKLSDGLVNAFFSGRCGVFFQCFDVGS